jgi:hypothetical protein
MVEMSYMGYSQGSSQITIINGDKKIIGAKDRKGGSPSNPSLVNSTTGPKRTFKSGGVY